MMVNGRKRWRLRIKVRTSLLLGGQTSPMLVDAATARYPSGLPIIPASALKGALRIEFERLARLAQKHGLIDGEPAVCDAGIPDNACGKEEGQCIVCRLFGTPGAEGKLRFHDAKIVDDALIRLFVRKREETEEPRHTPLRAGYDVRPGVGIGRSRKTSEEQLLFMSETLAPFLPDCIFEAEIEGDNVDETEERLLKQAVQSLIAIGGDKSRGLGRVEASLEEIAQENTSIVQGASASAQTFCLQVTLTPTEYVRVSTVKVANNFLDTYDFLPGSSVRGAVARSFAHSPYCPQGWQDKEFRRAFLRQPALFTEFYPTNANVPAKPIPLSARTCKSFPGFHRITEEEAQKQGRRQSHGAKDILLAAVVIRLLRKTGMPAELEDRCTRCSSALKELERGYYISPTEFKSYSRGAPHRMHTKTAINRQRGTSAEGQLYSYELMDAKLEYLESDRPRFIGNVTNLTPALYRHLQSLNGQTLLIGGARLRGYGKVKLTVEDMLELSSEQPQQWKQRMDRMTDLIKAPVLDAMSNTERKELESQIFFSLTLTSDLILPPGNWEQMLIEEVKTQLKVKQRLVLELAICRPGYRGGYNEAMGMRKDLIPVIVRGSAFVFSCHQSERDNILNALPALLKHGMGLRREEGFGRVSFCDPFHLERIQQE
jgi:CRISPR-associated protein Csx10